MRPIRSGSLVLILFAAAIVGGSGRAAAQTTVHTLARGFELENVADALEFPAALAFAPDGRLFFIERFTGDVRVILPNGTLLAAPFATIPDLALSGEQGLLGMAIDPNFAANGFIYFYHTQAAGPPVTITPDWRSIQDNVLSTSCASCHAGPTPPAGLDLTETGSFADLFEVASSQVPGLQRVDAGDPDDSYLIRKLEGGPGIVGQLMPPSGGALPPATINTIRTWIANGAPYNPGDPSNPPQAFRNRVVRYRAVGNTGVDPTVILDNIPAGTVHNGGVLEFAPDGTLFIQVGDAASGANGQNPATLAGKILRINWDGTIPADNPFVGTPGARPEIFSLGHRNGFGLAPDTINATNPPRVYVSENGLTSHDEINLGRAGLNYGWPTFAGDVNQPGFEDPIFDYPGAPVAPTGIVQVTSGVYAADYAGDLLVGEFNARDIDPNPFVANFASVVSRFAMSGDGNTVLSRSDFLVANLPNGRTHPIDLLQGPDGLVYMTTVNTSSDLLGAIWRFNWVDDDYDGCDNDEDPAPNTPSADADGDTWGADCDCDDANANVNPGRAEVPGNGLDDDCNPGTPGGCPPQPQAAEAAVGGAAPLAGAGDLLYYALPALAVALLARWRRRI